MMDKKQSANRNRYKPVLREHQGIDIYAAIRQAVHQTISNEMYHPYKTCLSCDNFNEETEQCKLVNARPPARIIAFGCEEYSDKDEIPF